MIRLSTGLQSSILGNYGVTRMMNYGPIAIYAGTPPPYAHWAPNDTLLGIITAGGIPFVPGTPTGVTLDRSEAGVLKDTGDWVLTGLADGEAGWWRWKWYNNDPDTTDPYYPRMDGYVGDTLTLSNKTIAVGTTLAVDSFYLTIGDR